MQKHFYKPTECLLVYFKQKSTIHVHDLSSYLSNIWAPESHFNCILILVQKYFDFFTINCQISIQFHHIKLEKAYASCAWYFRQIQWILWPLSTVFYSKTECTHLLKEFIPYNVSSSILNVVFYQKNIINFKTINIRMYTNIEIQTLAKTLFIALTESFPNLALNDWS